MSFNQLNRSFSADGLNNPFARGGIPRSPERSRRAGGNASAGGMGGASSTPDLVMDGPSLMKAVEKRRKGVPPVVALSEQLGAIIDFVNGRNNIAKDLKQSLLILRETTCAVIKERDELEALARTAEESVVETASTYAQTDAPVPVGDRMAAKVREIATQVDMQETHQASKKRGRGSPTEATPEGTKVRVVEKTPQASTVAAPTEQSTQATTSQDATGNQWTVVGRKKKNRGRKRKETVGEGSKPKAPGRAKPAANAPRKRNKGDALILKTDESKYSEVLRAMRADDQLKELGADVRSIRRTRTGDMILELRKEATEKGTAYKALAEKVLGSDVQVRALTPEVTIQIKNLDMITEECEVVHALNGQCGVVVAIRAVRLRKGPAGTQVATVRLPLADGNTVLKVAQLKVGWSICPVSILQQPEYCFRCFENGHKSFSCKGPDRSGLCKRCGGAGHNSRDCDKPPMCMVCTGKREAKHTLGGRGCPAGRSVTKAQSSRK